MARVADGAVLCSRSSDSGVEHFKVKLESTGEQFVCGGDESLLHGMERGRSGAKMLRSIPVGCRGGGCGICRVRILQGKFETKKMSVKHVTEDQKQAGVVLACRAFPRSEILLELATPEIEAQPGNLH